MLARTAALLLRSQRQQLQQSAAAASAPFRPASTSAPGGAGIASGVPADLLKREVCGETLRGCACPARAPHGPYARSSLPLASNRRSSLTLRALLSLSPSQVVIYAPARTPSQQGMSNTATSLGKGGAWRIEFETKPK